MPSPLCQSQDLWAMRSEGAGGQAFFIDEVWLGFLVPGESCCARFGDCVAGDNNGVAVDVFPRAHPWTGAEGGERAGGGWFRSICQLLGVGRVAIALARSQGGRGMSHSA